MRDCSSPLPILLLFMAIYVIFGRPGSGKTTMASMIVYKNLKKGIPTLCNFRVNGGYFYDYKDDLGIHQMEMCDVIFDEAQIFANSRQFKSFPKEKIDWFCYFRHYNVRDVYVFSQSYNKMDVTIRDNATAIFTIRRLWWFPKLLIIRKIAYDIQPNEAKEMQDMYWYDKIFSTRFCWMPKYWPMFNSWECEPLPRKEWKMEGYNIDFYDSEGQKKLYKYILKKKKKLPKASSVADADRQADYLHS